MSSRSCSTSRTNKEVIFCRVLEYVLTAFVKKVKQPLEKIFVDCSIIPIPIKAVPPTMSKTSTLLIVVQIVKQWFVAPTPKCKALILKVILNLLVKFRARIVALIPNLVYDVVNPEVFENVVEVVETTLFQLVLL